MNSDKTTMIFKNAGDEYTSFKLFISRGKDIESYTLAGLQRVGRPHPHNQPEIPIPDPCVSREHGFFDTRDGISTYTASETTNGIYLNKRKLLPGECVSLKDGDELTIPVNSQGDAGSLMMICAFSESRIALWDSFMEARYDVLTGLLNRRTFEEQYERKVKSASISSMSLFILDIDDFKGINDRFGHSSGDETLKKLADELKLICHEGCAGRWGGDEFVGVINEEPYRTVEILNDLNKRLKAKQKDLGYVISISAGVCRIYNKRESDTLEHLLNNADKALYHAKYEGKARIFEYQPKS